MNAHDSNPFFATASDPQSLQLPLRQRFYHLTIRSYEVTAMDAFVRDNCRTLGISIGEDGAVELLIKAARFNPRVLLLALEFIYAMRMEFTRAAISTKDFQSRMASLTGMSNNP
jgi:Holliday junction resolvasome RuvABC ATP-dependent DNA helicase subunit